MNRTYDKIALYCCSVVLAGSIVVGIRNESTPTPPADQRTVYERSIDVLKEFVRGGDLRLGFKDTTELAGAYVDTNKAIAIYQTMIDTLKVYGLDTSDVYQVHRTVYPVFAGRVLHSYVVFDSVFDSVCHGNHWSPVMFTNANTNPE
ncbi:MAG: hypothetical protein JSS75_01715 [Bacteroidetes bacterium]|nr:hypothetical protein [Bacteroidota bacterium]